MKTSTQQLNTALICAIEDNDLKKVTSLLNQGASINGVILKDPDDSLALLPLRRQTCLGFMQPTRPLAMAIQTRNLDMIRVLLARGATPLQNIGKSWSNETILDHFRQNCGPNDVTVGQMLCLHMFNHGANQNGPPDEKAHPTHKFGFAVKMMHRCRAIKQIIADRITCKDRITRTILSFLRPAKIDTTRGHMLDLEKAAKIAVLVPQDSRSVLGTQDRASARVMQRIFAISVSTFMAQQRTMSGLSRKRSRASSDQAGPPIKRIK